MKFQLTTLVAVLCFQCSVFSMYDCGCSWEIDMVCIQADKGTIVTYPNACWAVCMGYSEADFMDASFDINDDPTCGCSIIPDPVCISNNTGELVFFSNSCRAECIGYTEDSFLNCNYALPTNPSCDCDFTINEVYVEIETGIYMPFPNACWANYRGYSEVQFVDYQSIVTNDLSRTVESVYELLIEDGSESDHRNEAPRRYENDLSDFSTARYSADLNQKLIKGASVFPNPAASRIYISLDLSKKIHIRMDISSSEGKIYRSLNHRATKGKQAINVEVSDLPGGLYILQVYADKESQSLKFMKQ